MSKEYVTFVRQFADLKEGETELFIKDLSPGPRKYDTKRVRAVIRRASGGASQGDVLWVRSETGVLDEKPWEIEILEELTPYVSGRPWTDLFSAMKR